MADQLSAGQSVTVIAEKYAERLEYQLQFHYRQDRKRFFYALRIDPKTDAGIWQEHVMNRLAELVPSLVVVRLTSDRASVDRDNTIRDCLKKMAEADGN